MNDLYQKLVAPFDEVFKDTRGGVELSYITGEQVISRLNEVLGVGAWSFTIKEHGINAEAEEAWVLAEIHAMIPGSDSLFDRVVRQQFGSQKIRRSRNSGQPLDIGFDLKGAATDALKKCASLLGVGLYLSKKEAPNTAPGAGSWTGSGQRSGASAAAGSNANAGSSGWHGDEDGDSPALACVECGVVLESTRFRDGTVWAPEQLAGYGRRKHNRVLCMSCYRAANNVARESTNAQGDRSGAAAGR